MSDKPITSGEEMSEHIKKWREKREKKLLDRIYGRNKMLPAIIPISAAVLGIKRTTGAGIVEKDINDENLPIEYINDKTHVQSTKNYGLQSILKHPKKSSHFAMSQKLQEWASSRGKPANSFRHLNCFVSQVAPKAANKLPLPTTRKVQFRLSDGKTMFTPRKPENEKQQRSKVLSLHNVKNEKLPSFIETKEIDEVELDSIFDGGPIASTPEEQIQPNTPEEQIQHSTEPFNVAQPPCNEESLKSMTVSALEELLSIVQANYSTEACEEWLLAIGLRNTEADELPQYWECIAAIEEARGNMYLALDSYQRAVEQGAEVKRIESCLDRMYDKLNALSIKTKGEKENVMMGDQTNKTVYNGTKSKDVFKSTIIAFARIQKKVKKMNRETGDGTTAIKYFVTPVRRSTRCSSLKLNSPFVTISNHVNELLPNPDDKNKKNNVEFRTNKALLDYF